MKRLVMASAVATVLLSVGLGAQGRNFSGTWTIDSEKTIASNPAGGGGGRGGAVGGTSTRQVAGTAGADVVAVGGGARGGGGGGAIVARSGAGGAVGGPVPTTITLDTKAFSITSGQTTTSYALDGSATEIGNATRKATAKASWQGDKLVIETTAETPNGSVVSHASWYLDGEWLVRENSSTAADGTLNTRKTYFKRQ